MRITRLSQGVDASRNLDAARRWSEPSTCCATYRAACDGFGVDDGAAGGDVCRARRRQRRSTFLSRAHGSVGFEAKVLSGDEEAALSYAGATADLEDVAVPTMIVDIGGGSTELAVETSRRAEELLDAARLRSGHRAGPRARRRDTRERRGGTLDDRRRNSTAPSPRCPSSLESSGRARLVGLAGTVATLAQLDAGLTIYDRDVVHHRVLSRATRAALARPPRRRDARGAARAIPAWSSGERTCCTAGLYVLDAVMGRLGVERATRARRATSSTESSRRCCRSDCAA